jgi:MraZ protein
MASLDFVGQFTCSLDAKKRVNIPSGIRKVFSPEDEDTIVFAPGLEGSNLYAYPLTEWKRLTKSFRTINPFDASVNEFLRSFAGGAYNIKMDGQGRILIPEQILNNSHISKEILIIGALTKLEFWNPQVYDEYRSKQKKSLADLAGNIDFARRVMDE